MNESRIILLPLKRQNSYYSFFLPPFLSFHITILFYEPNFTTLKMAKKTYSEHVQLCAYIYLHI